MAAWFVDYLMTDSKKKPGRMRVPVNAGTVPAAYATYANAVAAAMIGSGLMSVGGYNQINLVIPVTTTPVAAISGSEIRNKWQATMLIGGAPAMRFSVPASNDSELLIVNGSQIVADLSNSVFTGALAALLDSGGTVHMVEPDEGAVIEDWGPVLSQTRARKRPRVGGSR